MDCNEDKEVVITFLWTVENYSYMSTNSFFQSPVFEVESMEKTSWKLTLYPYSDKQKRFFSYYLSGSRVEGSNVIEIEYDFAILAEDGSVLKIHDRERIYTRAMNTRGSQFSLLREDMTTAKREAVLSGDAVRIRCRVWRTLEKTMTPVTLFARTAIILQKRSFFWNIAKFSSFEYDRENTNVRRLKSNDGLLIFNISVEENKVVVNILSLMEDSILIKFQPFITDANGSRIYCGQWKMTLNNSVEKVLCTLPFTKNFLMDNRRLYLKNDVLSLYCECSWFDGYDVKVIDRIDYGIASPCISTQAFLPACSSNTVEELTNTLADLTEDLQCLYIEGIFSDVKLCTTTKTFEVHKNILAARSRVFQGMFTTDLKEKMQETVDVPNLEDDIVHRMLLYMYTNALKGLEWESALKLYAAADKYEIDALKRKCSTFLKSNLRTNNVCDVLILADMHADVELKKTVQDYILQHEQEVFRSDEWKVFAQNDSYLAMETMLHKWNAQ